MFKIHVDISLFTQDEALGRVSGSIEVAVIPQIGDHISFMFPERDLPSFDSMICPGQLRVAGRIIPANATCETIIVLDDFTVKTRDEARKIMIFFEKCYDLFGEPNDSED